MKDPCLEIVEILDKAHSSGLDLDDGQYKDQLIRLINSPLFSLKACWEKIDWQVPESTKLMFLVFAALKLQKVKDVAFAIAELFARQPETASHIVEKAAWEKGLSATRLWCALFQEQRLDNVPSQIKSALFQVFEKYAPSCFKNQFDDYYTTYVLAAIGNLPTLSLEFLATSERVNPLYRGLGLHFLFLRLPPGVVKHRPLCERLLSLIENVLTEIDSDASETIDLSSLPTYDRTSLWVWHLWVISAKESIENGWRDSLVSWKRILSKYCAR